MPSRRKKAMDQCGCAVSPSSPPKRPDCCICRRKSSWLSCGSVQRRSAVGSPYRKAVRLAASSGVMPFIWSNRQTERGVGAVGVAGDDGWPGLAVVMVGSEPAPATEPPATSATGEPWRDECPRSRDPRCAWPAMCHLVLGPLFAALRLVRFGAVSACSSGPTAVAMTRLSHHCWYLRRRGRGPTWPVPADPVDRLSTCESATSSSV